MDKSPLAGPPPLATCPLTKNILLYGWVGVGGGWVVVVVVEGMKRERGREMFLFDI